MCQETQLDAIDRRILQVLQVQGRSTLDELALAVGLSPSATLRRVNRLEDGASSPATSPWFRPSVWAWD